MYYYIILDVLIIGIVVCFAFFGVKKGFARTLTEVIGYILSFMIAFSVASYVADYVYEKKIKETVVNSVSEYVEKKTDKAVDSTNESVDAIWYSIPPYLSALSEITGLDKEGIEKYIKDYSEKTNNNIEQTAIAVCENVIKPVATSAIKLTVALILIVVLLFAVKLIARFIGNIFNKSVFKGINKFLGGISGAAKGIIVTLALVMLISILLPIFDNEIYFITPQTINKTYIFKFFFNIVSGYKL